jgi:hypothetical protein
MHLENTTKAIEGGFSTLAETTKAIEAGLNCLRETLDLLFLQAGQVRQFANGLRELLLAHEKLSGLVHEVLQLRVLEVSCVAKQLGAEERHAIANCIRESDALLSAARLKCEGRAASAFVRSFTAETYEGCGCGHSTPGGLASGRESGPRPILGTQIPAYVEHRGHSTKDWLAVMNAVGKVSSGSPIFNGPEEILGGSGLPVLVGQTVLISPLAIVFAVLAIFAERTEKSIE